MNHTTAALQSNLVGIRYKKDIKKYEARINIKGHSYSKTFAKREFAIEWRKSMQDQKSSNRSLTCRELFPMWLEYLKDEAENNEDSICNIQTYDRYESDARNYFQDYFSKMKITDVTDEIAFDFVLHLKENHPQKKHLSHKTIINIVGSLSNFFGYCCLRKHIRLNPAKMPFFRQELNSLIKKNTKKANRNTKKKVRTLEEITLLLDAAYKKDVEFGLITDVMFSAALRLGEGAALAFSDFIREIDPITQQSTWYVQINKTRYSKTKLVQNSAKCGSNGLVPVDEALIRKVEEWKKVAYERGLDVGPCDPVFPSLARSQKAWSRALHQLSKKLNIRETAAHCLRHSAITFLACSGYNLQQVQKFARHSSINMTLRYFSDEHLKIRSMASTMSQAFIPRQILGCTPGINPGPQTYSMAS